jgi:class 3 adenylate cyclase/tetratricopeptide (TPR) repeat protein
MRLVCSNCGTENPPGRRFCDNCGSSLAMRCPTCGEENRSGARFCGNCGATLPGAAEPAAAAPGSSRPGGEVHAERRLVSVLFADIVGFTPMAEAQDPERVRDLLERYFATARTVIERHGGVVEKFIGDAVMAVWGTPVAREDDAERAVRAALELLPQIKTVDDQLQARAGVLTGEAAVNLGDSNQAMVAGDLVNTAARLQSVAQPDTVLVGEGTMQATSAAIAYEPIGETTLKGKVAPVAAWRALRVVAERGGRARSSQIEAPFVGREAELSLLKNLLHATQQEGRSRLVAVLGPGGIGKSRLAWELEKYVDGLVDTIYWHRGRSPSYGDGITFWALGEMVRRRAGLAELDDEATTRARISATVAQYVPADDERRWIESALLALLGVEPAPAGGREVLFAAWRTFFERIAQRGMTVLVFEDLQWADSGLLDFIDNVLEWSKGLPILVLALARPELLERKADFGSATRQFTSMPLDPLSADAMRQLLAGLVPGLPADAIDAIVGRADGIPLYAVETIRMLVADGRFTEKEGVYTPTGELGELAIPDTLRSLIASRLDALDPADRSLLQRAAVLGQTFTADTLAAVANEPVADVEARLRRLVRREILFVQADPRSPERGQYGFVQGLIREVAYGTLSRRERRERHLAAARYFEALGDDELAGVLASHYVAAFQSSEPGGEADAVATQARLALRGAADRAIGLGSYDQAADSLRQALAVTTGHAERADLLDRLALSLSFTGQYSLSMDAARQAIAAFEAAGQKERAARTAGLLASTLVDAGRQAEAIPVLEEALPAADDNPELRATLLARLSRVHMRVSHVHEAVQTADLALAIAEPRSMTEVIVEALNNKGAALDLVGRWREGTLLLEGAVKFADDHVSPELRLRVMNNLASLLDGDNPMRSAETLAEGIELARRWGVRGNMNWLINHYVNITAYLGGDWDRNVELLEQTLDEATDDADRSTLLGALLAYLAIRGEDIELRMQTWAKLSAGKDQTEIDANGSWLRGWAAWGRGDNEAAWKAFQHAYELLPLDGGNVFELLHAAVVTGDPVRIREAAANIEQFPGSGRVALGMRVSARSAVAALDNRTRDAVAGFLDAHQRFTDVGVEWLRAEMAIDASLLLPNEPQIRPLAESAERTFERLRARVSLGQLKAALSASGEVRREPAAPAAAAGAAVGRETS